MQRHIAGESVRKISREEGRDRATITKIVQSDEVRAYVDNLREQFYALGDLALETVRRGLQEGDTKLAYQILIDIGVVPNQAERAKMLAQETLDTDDARHKELLGKLVDVAFERHHIYGTPITELDEHLKKIGAKVNEETGKLEPDGPELKRRKLIN
ncbi:MAG: hypothetical protein WA755_13670 [Candidatus Acidiferrales bacterium]